MAFNKKTWKNQDAEYTNRYTVTNLSDGTTNIVREWGTIYQEGDKISAESMNDLEDRIEESLGTQVTYMVDGDTLIITTKE